MKNENKQEMSEEEKWMVERMRRHPELMKQMMGLLEEVEDEQGRMGDFDQMEELVVERVREIGRLGLQGWAQNKAEQTERRVPEAGARRGAKKKLSWTSSLGRMELEEREWRKGTRRLRPFAIIAKVRARGLSRRLQRLATDMGADCPFGKAGQKIKEHHGVEVAEPTLRRCVLKHARAMAKEADQRPAHTRLKAEGPEWIIASADGTMLPVVRTQEAPEGADRRKHRKLSWEEMRLVAAKPHGQASANYAATLGCPGDAGKRWSQVAGMSGWALNTRIHAIGDGAEWIARQAKESFGQSHRYTLDLYHVCDYLAQAAPNPRQSKDYVARMREAMRQNQSAQVLVELRARVEPEEEPEETAPVRKAVRYLENRPEQLDYAFAIERGLPVGSGMIESGHRHVLQARLKNSGAWWTPQNAHDMAQLRVTRANNLWLSYWSN